MKIQEYLSIAIDSFQGTDRQLARIAGVPPSTICRFMKGKAITSESLERLCAALELELRPKAEKKARKT